MNDVTAFADIGDNRMHHRAREASAATQKLVHLHSLLDRPWFCDRHGVRFQLERAGKGLNLVVERADGRVIATWTTRGDSIVFTTASGTELRTEILDCAVSITCEFLDQSRSRRN